MVLIDKSSIQNVTWYKDGHTQPQRVIGEVKITQWNLVIENAVTTDSGNYTCVLCNQNGCTDFTYKVLIIGKPESVYKKVNTY